MQKFKMAAKVAGKRYLGKVASRLWIYPVGQKFCQNRSISLCFRDKHVFAFYTEIQDGRQKWREKQFLGKVANRVCTYPVGQKFRQNRSISLSFRVKRVFAFNAEIQDGRQKWRKNDVCEKSPVDSADTLQVRNFVEIALSRSISEINMFLRFTQKFKMATKSGGKKSFR